MPPLEPSTRRQSRLPVVLLLGTLVILLLHSWLYGFLTDDAFISFRYARNFAHGQGLVFNPGFEKVEGYTNFLWVLLLSAADVLGLPPEVASILFSVALTAALWWLLILLAGRLAPSPGISGFVLIPAALLALTRSVAVWSTSGLETRLFETLILAGVLALYTETTQDPAPKFSFAALWFALATLTRPDGLLLAACAFAASLVYDLSLRRINVARLAGRYGVFLAPVGGHYLFRRMYYGDWFPNTYYAKVGGELWWSMGWKYLGMFVLEYGIYLWIPLLVPAYLYFAKRGRRFFFFLTLALVVPHALYMVSIGGDHFEYRPFDLYFPLLFILISAGLWQWRERLRRVWPVAAAAVVLVAGLTAYPWITHRDFPKTYIKGFPGIWMGKLPEADAFLTFPRSPIVKLPPFSVLNRAYIGLLRDTSASFVGIRREEHRLFLRKVQAEAQVFNRLIREQRLPPDAYIAISGVGAIPYYTNLRTLDRQGLTDAHVAHGEFAPGKRIMAHGKLATLEYARERGVDFWAYDPVHTFLHVTHPMFFWYVQEIISRDIPAYTAPVGDGMFMLVLLPQGSARTLPSFPALGLMPLNSPEALKTVVSQAVEAYREKLKQDPADTASSIALAAWFQFSGDNALAIPLYEAALSSQPFRPELYNNLALAYHAAGRDAEARNLLLKGIGTAEKEGNAAALESFRTILNSLKPN